MRKSLIPLYVVGSVAVFLSALVWVQIYGPQPLVPPSDWPFTAESRKAYDPLGEHSVNTTKAWARDLVSRVR